MILVISLVIIINDVIAHLLGTMLKRSSLMTSANMTSAKNCEVYAFVLAMPEYCDGEGFFM